MDLQTSAIDIVPVQGKALLEEFIRVPWSLYRDDPCWVPPLLAERRQAFSAGNPFFRHAEWQAWIARRGGQAVGRISAQVDRLYLEHQDPHGGFFGLIEGVDDPVVFAALVRAAEAWLADRGMRRVVGPFNLGINQEMGLLVEGFDTPPFIMTGHARPYYAEQLRELGYVPAQDTVAYELAGADYVVPGSVARLLKRQAHRISCRGLVRRQLNAELELMRSIFNDAWAQNWGFVPFTAEEFQAVGRELLKVVPPEYMRIAEVDGEAAAFIVLLPNINEVISDLDGRLWPLGWARLLWRLKVRSPTTARIPLMGVRQKFHHTRLGPALALRTITELEQPARARGVERIELSWILDDNQGVRHIIEQIGGKVSKRYRMFRKDLA